MHQNTAENANDLYLLRISAESNNLRIVIVSHATESRCVFTNLEEAIRHIATSTGYTKHKTKI